MRAIAPELIPYRADTLICIPNLGLSVIMA
jgi:hypothetical protein